MSTFPRNRAEFLTWLNAHLQPWQDNDSMIGLTEAQILQLSESAATLTSAITAQESTKQAALAATEAANTAERTAKRLVSDALRLIRARATSTDNPLVYEKAQIPPPSAAGPSLPPGTPDRFTIGLNQAGAVTLRWRCQNPPGGLVVYNIRRRFNSASAFASLGAVGTREYNDASIPSGSSRIEYQIQAQRGQLFGPPANFTVMFGAGGGGAFILESGGSADMNTLNTKAA